MSVANAGEARAALGGGAHIIDAKDPRAGPLGAVDSQVLRELLSVVPPMVPLSVAMGEPCSPREAREAVLRIGWFRTRARSGEEYVKLSFPATCDAESARELLSAAVDAAIEVGNLSVVAAAFADRRYMDGVTLLELVEIAAEAGATGLLLDTAMKNGKTLFDVCDEDTLRDIIAQARRRGVMPALAGSLRAADLPRAKALGAAIVGVRGAACDGGRIGTISENRVRVLRETLDQTAGAPSRSSNIALRRSTSSGPSTMHGISSGSTFAK